MFITESLSLFIVYYYVFIGVMVMITKNVLPQWYITIVLFIFFKMISGLEKCTVSFIECKLRGVKKEEGYLYSFLNTVTKLKNTKHVLLLYPMALIFVAYFYYKIIENKL